MFLPLSIDRADRVAEVGVDGVDAVVKSRGRAGVLATPRFDSSNPIAESQHPRQH